MQCLSVFFPVILLSTRLFLFDPAGFLDILLVFKDCSDKLTKQALHVALATWKQTLQEGDVSTMSRQQQGNIRQGLDYGHGKGYGWREYSEKQSDFS